MSCYPACYRPEERKKHGYYGEHRRQVNKTITTQARTIILGDSVRAGLTRYPSVYDPLRKQHKIVNCAIPGDRIENVMWRIEHFSIPVSVRAAILVVGTNNIDADKPEDIALGLISCAARLRERNSQLHVFVSAILPRDLHVTTRRAKIRQTNTILKSLCLREPDISYIEQSSRWVDGCDQLNEMLYHTDYLHLIKAGNEIFASQLVAAISPIVDGEPRVKKYRTRKRSPRVPLTDSCTYRHKTPPPYPPPPPPISYPCQQPQSSPLPPSPTSATFSSSPNHPPIHSTPTHSSFIRARSGISFIVNLYIYLFLILLFFTRGVEAGGRDGINIFSDFLFPNDSVFIEGLRGRAGVFTGVMHENISFDKTFVFPNTSEFKIQSRF